MSWWDWRYVEELDEVEIRVATFHLSGAMSTLTHKQRFVIELRFGLRDGVTYSQEEIAEAMGISHQNVCRLEQTAMTRLRGF